MPNRPRGACSHGGRSAIIGRERERAQLRKLLDDAIASHGSLVLMSGEAGIGKTTLVDDLIHDAEQRDCLVLSGACYDLTTTPPYGPWVELRHAQNDEPSELAGIFKKARASGAPSSQQELFEEALDFFARVNAARSVVLVLEDLHWADQVSLDLLRFLARRLTHRPILILATYRQAGMRPDDRLYRVLPELVRESSAIRISLHRLANDDVRQLIRDRYALAEPDLSHLMNWLDRLAEGNPFFIEELLQSLEVEHVLQPREWGWQLGGLASVRVPPLLRLVIDGLLERLEPSAHEQLQVAAVIGGEISIDLWQHVTTASDEELAEVVKQALRAQVLVELRDRPAFQFRHALVRQALYEQMILPRRDTWHRRVAEVLADRSTADPDVVAYHFLQASDARAIDWLIRAGRRAAQAFAFSITKERFKQALAMLRHDAKRHGERAWLLCELAEAHRYTDSDRTLKLLDEARLVADDIDDQALRSIVLFSRARTRGLAGENALAELRDAAAAYDALSAPDHERIAGSALRFAVSRATYAQTLAQYGCYRDALTQAESFLAEPTSPDPREFGNAHFALGLACAGLGMPDRARIEFARARGYFRKTDNFHLIGATLDWEIDLIMQVYFPEDIDARHRLMEDTATAWRHSVYGSRVSAHYHPTVIDTLLLDGRWAEARTSATALSHSSSKRLAAARVLADLDRMEGNHPSAWAHISTALPAGPRVEPSRRFFPIVLRLLRVAAELALDEQDLETAREWITALERWLTWSDIVIARAAPHLLWSRFHLLAGDTQQAWHQAEQALDHAQRPRQPLEALQAHRALGRVATQTGCRDVATHHLGEAYVLSHACGYPHELALTALAQAALLISSGNPTGARRQLDSAWGIACSLGAGPVVKRVQYLHEQMEIPAHTPVEPGNLSPRELEVLRLVAQSLTDAEIGETLFISPRTVHGHLRSIYKKLGISSRTAAAAFAFKNELVD